MKVSPSPSCEAGANNERRYVTRYGQVEVFSLDSTFTANSDVESVELRGSRATRRRTTASTIRRS